MLRLDITRYYQPLTGESKHVVPLVSDQPLLGQVLTTTAY